MKKSVILIMVAGLFFGLSVAAEKSEKEAKKVNQDTSPSQNETRMRRGIPARMRSEGSGPLDRRQMQQKMLAERADVHKKAIDELEAIKKIAQEEGAVRTVEALQKMIDKKNDEYKKRVENFSRKQQELAEQIRQRTSKSDVTPSEKKADKAKQAASPQKTVN